MNNKKLAKYLHKNLQSMPWRNRGELFTELTADLMEFGIQRFQAKGCAGHFKGSNRFQRNIGISDDN